MYSKRNWLEFDPPYNFSEKEICQLIPEEEWQIRWEIGPDPPWEEQFDPDHFQENIDLTYTENDMDPPNWEEKIMSHQQMVYKTT